MKKNWYQTKGFIFGIIFALGISAAFAAGVPVQTSTDEFIHGRATSTDDKEIEFNTGDSPNNIKIKVDDSKNGAFSTNQFSIGDGTNTVQKFIFDQAGTDVEIEASTGQALNVKTNSLSFGDGTAADQ